MPLVAWYHEPMNMIDDSHPGMSGQLPTGPDMSEQWLSVPEAVAYAAERGLNRNIKTVRRWAQRSHAHPENTPDWLTKKSFNVKFCALKALAIVLYINVQQKGRWEISQSIY